MRPSIPRARPPGVALAVILATGVAAGPARAATDDTGVRGVAEFDRISVHDSLAATVIVGSPERVTIVGDPATFGRVTTVVRDGTLVVAIAKGASSGRLPHVAIALPIVRGLHADGSSSIRASGVAGTDDLQIEDGGSARIAVAGRVALESVSLEGSGTLDATELDAGDVTVDAIGSGDVRVRCSGELAVRLDGSGRVRWAGAPRRIRRTVHGSGAVAPL